MAYVVKDRVKVTSTTTGTGTFTLGAAAVGFQSFAAINPTWNVTTAAYLQSRTVSGQDTSPSGMFFKPDGLKMYIVGTANNNVYEYNLSTAWNISTTSFLQSFSVAAQDVDPNNLFFKPDGLKMYVVGPIADSIYEYNLSTAWDISTASFFQSESVVAQSNNPSGLFFKPDGLKMYISSIVNDSVNEYNLSTAWDITTSSYLQNFLPPEMSAIDSVFFKPDGLKMYLLGNPDSVFEYNLSTAWDISTASFFQSFFIGDQESNPTAVFFNPNGGIMYVVGTATDAVYQYLLGTNTTYYCITDGTNWEVGIGDSTDAGTALSRTTVLESSNSNALVNFSAGTKDVFVTFPSENTLGTVPTADNSSVGTDLVAWLNLKKQLDAGVVNGVPYANNSRNGIVSTYSLVYTVFNAYQGGVLAPNGDIHFVPYAANRGQKVSSTGVVSTYSLVYTANNAYLGGVLASNGDIHFVQFNANRGQKLNSSGVVSTYSLVYTTTNGYQGGVLAPNGDIHFVPRLAVVGQKISVAGVVSTYSLVYTAATGAYSGGVLAPNGDIHFIPANANRGQKISAAGVVSTYSLVYTTTSAYYGGVLAPNGDIHFIPDNAGRGQKISSSGVVSTYSLVYTLGGKYAGGVLAPNGDIHFINVAGTIGQKVSAAGVVSTYSLLKGEYVGGVLAPNGDIHFVPYNSEIGQKISTNAQQKVGYALSPFFNKF